MPSKTTSTYDKDIESLGKTDPVVARFLDSASDLIWDESDCNNVSSSQHQQPNSRSFMQDNSYRGGATNLNNSGSVDCNSNASNRQLVQRERMSLVTINVADGGGSKVKNICKPREKKVDQSGNLMDADANVYERNGRDGLGGRQVSLEDIFLADDSEAECNKLSFLNKSFGSLQKKIFPKKTAQARCLRLLATLLVLAVCTALVTVLFPSISAGHVTVPSFSGSSKEGHNDSQDVAPPATYTTGEGGVEAVKQDTTTKVERPTYYGKVEEEITTVERPVYNDNEEEETIIVERPTYDI